MPETITIESFQKMTNEARLALASEGYRQPRIAHDSDERVLIKLSPEDRKKASGRGVHAFSEQPEGGVIVTDLVTGKKYRWEVAACSSPTCFCDAVVTEVPLSVVK